MKYLTKKKFIIIIIILIFCINYKYKNYIMIVQLKYIELYSGKKKIVIKLRGKKQMYRIFHSLFSFSVFPHYDELESPSTTVIETDGMATFDAQTPYELAWGFDLIDNDDFYFTDKPANEGNLYRWSEGKAISVPKSEADTIISRACQLTEDQCKLYNWKYIDHEKFRLNFWDNNKNKIPLLYLRGKEIRIQADNSPPIWEKGVNNRVFGLKIFANEKLLFSKVMPYKQVIRGLTEADWEAFRGQSRKYPGL